MSTRAIWVCVIVAVLLTLGVVALASCTPYDTAPPQPSGIEIDVDPPKGGGKR